MHPLSSFWKLTYVLNRVLDLIQELVSKPRTRKIIKISSFIYLDLRGFMNKDRQTHFL